MKCPKCGSENVTVQIVTETELKEKKHGCLWWCCIGWWWFFVKWLVFTFPALLVKLFAPKKYKLKTHTKKMAVCNGCGNSWQV